MNKYPHSTIVGIGEQTGAGLLALRLVTLSCGHQRQVGAALGYKRGDSVLCFACSRRQREDQAEQEADDSGATA